jgi:hypothetical protein
MRLAATPTEPTAVIPTALQDLQALATPTSLLRDEYNGTIAASMTRNELRSSSARFGPILDCSAFVIAPVDKPASCA